MQIQSKSSYIDPYSREAKQRLKSNNDVFIQLYFTHDVSRIMNVMKL